MPHKRKPWRDRTLEQKRVWRAKKRARLRARKGVAYLAPLRAKDELAEKISGRRVMVALNEQYERRSKEGASTEELKEIQRKFDEMREHGEKTRADKRRLRGQAGRAFREPERLVAKKVLTDTKGPV